MFSLVSVRSLFSAAVGFTALAASAQVISVQLDGMNSGWLAPTGSNYIAANGPATDFVRSGTGTTGLGCDVLNISLANAYSPLTVNAGGTKLAGLSYTNAPTTGGGIQAVGYQLTLDLFADGALVAPDVVFALTFEFGHDDATGTDFVRRTGGSLEQVVNIGGIDQQFSLQFANSPSGFLEAESLWYGVTESSYDVATGAPLWGRGLSDLTLSYSTIAGPRALVADAPAAAAVPEPATYGWMGASALIGFLLFRRVRFAQSMRD